MVKSALSNQFDKHLSIIADEISKFTQNSKSIILSSSFQTHSIPLLHIICNIDNTIPVYFLDTGYHFPETLQFKKEIEHFLNIKVIALQSKITKQNQYDKNGFLLYAADTDLCCFYNKVMPMDELLNDSTVWISGLRKNQTTFRKGLSRIMKGAKGSLRYHPILEWTNKMIWEYQKLHNLPKHPLEAQGYLSIGCEPCTAKPNLVDIERENRWQGLKKIECGLHTELIKQ